MQRAAPQNIKKTLQKTVGIMCSSAFADLVLHVDHVARGWARHQPAGGEQLYCGSLVSLELYSPSCFITIIIVNIIIIIMFCFDSSISILLPQLTRLIFSF